MIFQASNKSKILTPVTFKFYAVSPQHINLIRGTVTMFEIGLALTASAAMGKIADADGRSAAQWGFLTLALTVASLVIPLPFLQVIVATVIAFIIMVAVPKPRSGRRF